MAATPPGRARSILGTGGNRAGATAVMQWNFRKSIQALRVKYLAELAFPTSRENSVGCGSVLSSRSTSGGPQWTAPTRRKQFLSALVFYRVQALPVELDQILGVILCSRRGTALKASAGCSGTAKTSGGGDELHHFERDLFISTHRWWVRKGNGVCIAHRISPGLN